jgi:hypothetical protein
MSLTGRSRCTSCLAYVSTALFLELDHLCHNCYQGDEDYPLQSTPGEIDAANECLSQAIEAITPENRHAGGFMEAYHDHVCSLDDCGMRPEYDVSGGTRVSAIQHPEGRLLTQEDLQHLIRTLRTIPEEKIQEALERTEETSPSDIDPVAI